MPIFEQLEPRILLSADLIPLPVDTDPTLVTEPLDELAPAPQDTIVDSNNTALATEEAASNDQIVDEIPPSSAIDTQSPQADVQSEQTEIAAILSDTSIDPQEFIFINDDIEGFEELKQDLEQRENSELIILNSKEDGLTQIDSALESAENIQALHFFTHGNDSSIKVGSSWINSSNLEQNQDDIRSWGEHLNSEGDILFYGCHLAGSNDGTDLLQKISEITGADVAASDDATGHQAMGGDWVLEYSNGGIETQLAPSTAFQSEWMHILAEETIADNFATAVYNNNDGSVNWVGDWIEIGENDGADSGNVTIEGGELRIHAADNDEILRTLRDRKSP